MLTFHLSGSGAVREVISARAQDIILYNEFEN